MGYFMGYSFRVRGKIPQTIPHKRFFMGYSKQKPNKRIPHETSKAFDGEED